MHSQKPVSLNSLFKRSQFVSIGIIVLIFLFLVLPLTLYMLKSYSDQQLKIIGKTLADSVQPAMVFNDKKAIQAIINDTTLNYSVQKVYVYDAQHNLINESQKPEQQVSPIQDLLDKHYLNEPRQIFISHKDMRVGSISVYGSSEKLVQFIWTFFIGIISALFLILISLWFFNRNTQRQFIQSIQPIIETARKVHQQQAYDLHFPNNNIAEFQEITITFNQLLAKVHDVHNNLEHENRRLTIQASHDSLTALPNRASFTNHLRQTFLDKGFRSNTALLFIDNNNFKLINDKYGHQAGDMVLIEMARRLKKNLRSGDIIARLGGDEFAVLLYPIYNVKDVIRIAETLIATCYAPLIYENHHIAFSFSIGIALSKFANSPEELINQADQAMYQAKKSVTHWSLFKNSNPL